MDELAGHQIDTPLEVTDVIETGEGLWCPLLCNVIFTVVLIQQSICANSDYNYFMLINTCNIEMLAMMSVV